MLATTSNTSLRLQPPPPPRLRGGRAGTRFFAGLCAVALRQRAVRPDVRSELERNSPRNSPPSGSSVAADSLTLVRFLVRSAIPRVRARAARPGEVDRPSSSGLATAAMSLSSISRTAPDLAERGRGCPSAGLKLTTRTVSSSASSCLRFSAAAAVAPSTYGYVRSYSPASAARPQTPSTKTQSSSTCARSSCSSASIVFTRRESSK